MSPKGGKAETRTISCRTLSRNFLILFRATEDGNPHFPLFLLQLRGRLNKKKITFGCPWSIHPFFLVTIRLPKSFGFGFGMLLVKSFPFSVRLVTSGVYVSHSRMGREKRCVRFYTVVVGCHL